MNSRPQRANDWGGRGSNNRRAKLTEEQVVEIKRLLSQGVPQRDIAAQFGVDPAVVSGIKVGRYWSHVRGMGG